MNDNDILSGFSAVFENLGQPIDFDNENKDNDIIDDDDLNSLFTGNADDDGNELDDKSNDDDSAQDPDGSVDNDDDDATNENDTDGSQEDNNETQDPVILALFDAIAESAGWGSVDDEEKPKSAEDLVSYMQRVVEQNSLPNYSSNDVRDIDEFVRNGGRLEDYFTYAANGPSLDDLDISNENTQKALIREFLMEKGFNEAQIQRKINKYEEADILEDEASDAIESLKELREEKKKELLENQKFAHQSMMEEQQRFYNNVIGEIEALTDVRGIKIPKQDKQDLMEYIFKVESDGRTKYQKDYAKSTKNLIESAYFTMKGDSLLNSAKKSGETSAVEKLKNTLNSNKVSGSKQRIDNRSARPLWSVASSQLMRRPQ